MKLPRMLLWLVLTLVLIVLAHMAQAQLPGSLAAVTLYKAHLLVLGGWVGYWLDRALFPYDRPHEYLELADNAHEVAEAHAAALEVSAQGFHEAMLRRAIIVAACVVAVCLGA
jgi:Putative 2/3 transmembrane domain holin